MPIVPNWTTIAEFPRYEISQDGVVRIIATKRVIASHLGNQGSMMINLRRDGKAYSRQMHRLLAAAFIGNVDGLTINHKNGLRADNRLENLEIVTQAENNRHKIDVLGKGRGELVNFAKLTEADVLEIRRLRKDGCMVRSIVEKFGIHREQVRNICLRKQWRHI